MWPSPSCCATFLEKLQFLFLFFVIKSENAVLLCMPISAVSAWTWLKPFIPALTVSLLDLPLWFLPDLFPKVHVVVRQRRVKNDSQIYDFRN